MRILIRFFAGLVILSLIGTLFHVTLLIHEHSQQQRVTAMLIQTADSWQQRMDAPTPLEFIDEDFVRNHLIVKFVGEYLSIIPNQAELA